MSTATRTRRPAAATIARSWAVLCLGAVALVVAPAARADIWGFVDDAGQVHLATERVDPRYALFMKGGAAAEAPTVAAPATGRDALAGTRLFQRLVAHPNIARFESMIRAAAERAGLEPALVKAVVAVESGFEPGAVSDKGAVGLMQVLPATGERYGLRADRRRTVEQKLADPATNLDVGTRYLADLRRQFAARPELALAAYNAGENAVVRFRNTVPPFAETQSYVKLVDQFMAFYRPVPIGPATSLGGVVESRGRLRFTLPARRNLPDPDAPLRLPAAADPSPTAARALDTSVDERGGT